MEAPFGVYPTSDGWVTIAMSPYTRLVGVLGDDSLLAYNVALARATASMPAL